MPREIKTIIMPSAWIVAIIFAFINIFALNAAFAQKKSAAAVKDTLKAGDFSGLKFRSIGPAYS